MNNWDKILKDFAHKCGDGGPSMTNSNHLALLRESLIKFGWKENATNEFIGNLREGKEIITEDEPGVFMGYIGGKENKKRYFPNAEKLKAAIGRGSVTAAPGGSSDEDEEGEEKIGKTTELPKQVDKEQDKNLNQDIDYSGGENTPEHITAEITPTDEEFEEKKERGKIKEQTYKNKTIEVNGKTYDQPLSVEDVESFFPNPPYKFPKKYIKTLQRILNTQQVSKTQPSIKEFVDEGGAGEIPAQSAELLTMMTATMSPEEANAFYEVLLATSENQTENPILDQAWIEAAQASSNTVVRQVKEDYGEEAEIEFGGWDTKADVEEGIGLPDHRENKGDSTDVFFRVKTPDGSKIHEVTLKKDLQAYWANPGAAKIQKKLDDAGVGIFEPEGDLSAEEVRERDSVVNLTENQRKHSIKRVSEIDQKQVDRMIEKSDEEILEDALKLPQSPTDIYGKVTEGVAPNKRLSKKAVAMVKFMRKLKEDGKYPLPWDEKTLNDPEFQSYCKENFGYEIDFNHQEGIQRFSSMANSLLLSQEISEGIDEGPAWQYLDDTVGMKKKEDGKFKPGSGKAVCNKFLMSLGKPQAAKVVMEMISENFPLRSMMEGEESMAAGNQSIDKNTLKEIFGTDDYDKIQEGITTKEDSETGEVYLIYEGTVVGTMTTVKLGKIECRQRGGASPTVGITPSQEFQHRVFCINAKRGISLTKAENREFKKLESKFGKCGEATY
jgi:hypothetical protein